MEIRKAERRKAKLRLGIASVSGGGKTYSSLLLAFGLGGKVGMIDTENGSGDLYAHLGDYDVITLQSPYTVAKYREAIKAFESAGYSTVIIDSLSHAWAGDGGMLDKQGKIAEITKNSYTAWRSVTPEHNSLVEAMLTSPCHIIATMRSKQEYAIEQENGRNVVKKMGLAPVQREGMEYEFTVMLDIAGDHTARATKDRTGMFDGQYFKITPDTGRQIAKWLEQGKDAPAAAPAAVPAPSTAKTEKAPEPGSMEEALKTHGPEKHNVAGTLESVKMAQGKFGTRYGIKLKGKAELYGTASAPAAQRAEQMIGKEVMVTYCNEGGKKALMGLELAKLPF
jgi:hypothetical protein